MFTKKKIGPGSRIYLSGGYDFEINWLNGRDGYIANVLNELPGQNDKIALLVEFEEIVITKNEQKGKYAVLELRYNESSWVDGEVVHIELCDFFPDNKSWKARRQGIWVESNASIKFAK